MVFTEEGQLQMNWAQYDPALDAGDPHSHKHSVAVPFLHRTVYDETYLISNP